MPPPTFAIQLSLVGHPEGMAVGEETFSNRPDVLGSAHDLPDRLDSTFPV